MKYCGRALIEYKVDMKSCMKSAKSNMAHIILNYNLLESVCHCCVVFSLFVNEMLFRSAEFMQIIYLLPTHNCAPT